MNDNLLTTRAAARVLGVGPSSVKRWADAGLLRCVRTPGGHRRFPRQVVESLLARDRDTGALESPSIDRWVDLLATASDPEQVPRELALERDRAGSWTAVADFLAAVLAEVGERWQRGELTALQEHLASERLARALARISDRIPVGEGAPAALLMTAEGEEHTLGLSLLEPCLREAGYSTRFAGRQFPLWQLDEYLAANSTEIVAVSASARMSDAAELRVQAEALARTCHRHGVQLLLGGAGAWPEVPLFGRRIGALEHLIPAIDSLPKRLQKKAG